MLSGNHGTFESLIDRNFLDKQLLAAARQPNGDVEELLTSEEYREPQDKDSFIFDINCTDL